MPASIERLVFGPGVDPDAQVVLPHFVESGKPSDCVRNSIISDNSLREDDGKCLGRIWYVKEESDTASWYKIWEAVTAVYSVCNRKQQRGTFRGLG